MSVPLFTGNAFNQGLNSMNQFFAGIGSNHAQQLQNQYLPQLLAQQQQQGQQNLDSGQQKFDLARILQPMQVATAQTNLNNLQNPKVDPLAQQKAQLENQKLQQQIKILAAQQNVMDAGYLPITNPSTGQVTWIQSGIPSKNGKPGVMGGQTMPSGKIVLDENGNSVATPTTQSISNDQRMNTARSEGGHLLGDVSKGVSPYSGFGGKYQQFVDTFAYRTNSATPKQIDRLKKHAIAVGISQQLAGSLNRASTGGEGSEGDRKKILENLNIPESGGPLIGGFSPHDQASVFTGVKNSLDNAGFAANNTAISPTVGHSMDSTSDGDQEDLVSSASPEQLIKWASYQGGS